MLPPTLAFLTMNTTALRVPSLLSLLTAVLMAQAAHAAPPAAPLTLKAAQVSSLGITSEAVQAGGLTQQRFPAQVVIPVNQEQVVAAPVAGLIESLSVSAGDAVRAGQWLVRMRSPQAQELGRDVLQSGSQLELARRTAQRDEALYKEGLIPLSRLEASRAQLTQQQAQAQERRQALTLAGGTVTAPNGAISVNAPLSGRVLAQLVQVGQRVDAMTPLYRIATLSPLWLEIQVPAKLAGDVRTGDVVQLAGADGVKGQVISLGASVDAKTQSIMVRARITPTNGKSGEMPVRPGQWVEAALQTGHSANAVTLNSDAVLTSPGHVTQVFVDQGAGRYQLTNVQVLSRQGKNWTVSGLAAGTKVVTRGTSALKALLGN